MSSKINGACRAVEDAPLQAVNIIGEQAPMSRSQATDLASSRPSGSAVQEVKYFEQPSGRGINTGTGASGRKRPLSLAAAYARVSSDRQDKEQTIDSQVDALRRAAEQRGWHLAARPDLPRRRPQRHHAGPAGARPAARPGRRGDLRDRAGLLARSPGPQLRLSGAGDRRVQAGRLRGRVPQPCLRRQPGAADAAADAGRVRRVRARPDPGPDPTGAPVLGAPRAGELGRHADLRLSLRPREPRAAPASSSRRARRRWCASCTAGWSRSS